MTFEEVKKLKEQLHNEDLDLHSIAQLMVLDRIENFMEDSEEEVICTFNGNRGISDFKEMIYEVESRFDNVIEDLVEKCINYEDKSNMCEAIKENEKDIEI